jgi:hypothetical protein
MKFTYMMFAIGIAIASVAAWFSILGLMATFSASWVGVLCMGAVIEAGKVSSLSWLSRYWNTTITFGSKCLKWALLVVALVAMLVTSYGIFGYLSKAHIGQKEIIGGNSAKIEQLDRLIGIEQREIDDSLKVMAILDETVQTLIEYDKISNDDGAKAVRKSQQSEREELKDIIESSQKEINRLEEEKFELNATARELKTEIGPILYLAAMIYDNPEDSIDEAVRIAIILLIFIFDPLAILMLLAANHSLRYEESKKFTHKPDDTPYSGGIVDKAEEQDSGVSVANDNNADNDDTEDTVVEDTTESTHSGHRRKTTGWLSNQRSSKT